MKTLVFALSLLSFGLVCCSKSKPTYCVADVMSHVEPSTDSLKTAVVWGYDDNVLKEFETVVDKLNSTGDPLIHSSYFLYDITGDGEVELWINSGSCEADKMLKVFTIDNGKARKI